jgi:hypothetical protein
VGGALIDIDIGSKKKLKYVVFHGLCAQRHAITYNLRTPLHDSI